MRPLADFPAAARAQIRGFLCDIDDTLTTHGRLTAAAYTALERLHDAGLIVVAVTGRPAGWCDHLARMWPLDAVVGENGAFYFRYDHATRTMQRSYAIDAAERSAHRSRLDDIRDTILASVPGSAVAQDQAFRIADLAIDYCEDVAALAQPAAEEIAALMREQGLTAKVSSIHVNGWFGDYDKLSMTKRLMREHHRIDLDARRQQFVFVGDSPNDAPMFAYFPNSVGVANVKAFAGRLEAEPAYVTKAESGAGFCELAEILLTR